MPRTVRNPKIDSRSARARLAVRREPYWTAISEGCAVGYRKGGKGGTWIARYRDDDGRQHYAAQGAADDARDADGVSVYSFHQAQERSRAFFALKARERAGGYPILGGPLTVADAIASYRAAYLRRGGKAVDRLDSAVRAWIMPTLGSMQVARLTRHQIERWHEQIANSGARARPDNSGKTQLRAVTQTPDSGRARKATANRILTILKAALNHALHASMVVEGTAWRTVKAFREVDAVRLRYLGDDEIRRLVNASSEEFRPVVIAALMTGCRYGELTRLVREDFDPAAGTLRIGASKSGKPRHVALADEARVFFDRLSVRLPPGALMLTKANGRGWRKSEQQRPLDAACRAARIAPITFHGLRHTYASRLAMNGVPLAVIASQLGHSDTRMVEKHYGHLAPNYIAETVRAALPPLGIVSTDNIVGAAGRRRDRMT